MKKHIILLASFFYLLLALPGCQSKSAPKSCTVWSEDASFVPLEIVVPASMLTPEDTAKAKENIKKINAAVGFLQEGIRRMTGHETVVTHNADVTRGIVLATLKALPPELQADGEIQKALRNDDSDAYNDREAFYIRSEPERVLVVANTADGLLAAVVELLESVDYEVLGMGPNWIHTPQHKKSLVFQIQRAGRPSYYIRDLWATSAQQQGVGTISKYGTPLVDPADELVETSYERWRVGSRQMGRSMADFPGHAMQEYHRAVVAKMKELNTTSGLLAPQSHLGPEAQRPAAAEDNNGHFWISTDTDAVYLSDGKTWIEPLKRFNELANSVDPSLPFVREIVLADMKKKSEAFFASEPDAIFIFGTEPEDGGDPKHIADKNWYPEYLKKEGITFGQPYALHGTRGFNQPQELWDENSLTDMVFGFNNWLLREYNKWIDSLPEDQRVTKTGQSKKNRVRTSLYSYNYHDIPPNFNLDPRIRVMIAGFAKHRGAGKWEKFMSREDVAEAFQVLLPQEPSGDYDILTTAYYTDFGLQMLVAPRDASAAAVSREIRTRYDKGIKGQSMEIDFNFGRTGLYQYLVSKMLWNAHLSAAELDVLRDRWLKRAYGKGWQTMKKYYDFMLPQNFPSNSPQTWAEAIRFIDQADKEIDETKEPDAQRRLDDLKQYWYCAYLFETGKIKDTETVSTDETLREFVWKGQMSYMNPMFIILKRSFLQNNVDSPFKAAGPELTKTPAHYTHEETQVWWNKLLEHWPLVPVTKFADVTLANGKKGKEVDMNDLVRVKEFGEEPALQGFVYNAQFDVRFVCVARQAGEEIGFKLSWLEVYGYPTNSLLPYGIDRWDSKIRRWESIVDKTQTSQPVIDIQDGKGRLAEVRFVAPQAGTYRFDIGCGGLTAFLTDLSYDVASAKHTMPHAFSFCDAGVLGQTQSGIYLYIPKGTPSLDLDVVDENTPKTVTFYKDGIPGRNVDIDGRGLHRVPLEPGEAGSLAKIEGNGFTSPYFHSVPRYWAKSPSQLVVPRAVAVSDGLTILP